MTERRRNLAAISTMNNAQAHRGPDGEGYLFANGDEVLTASSAEEAKDRSTGQLALGHRRLAILDTSAAGQQPMVGQDGHSWLIHNGEIYNYLELRAELSALGHGFHTRTDTEVILAAYAEWGTACFAHFNGMWALAIWDHRNRRLVLSRDRFGIKPLYIAKSNEGLVFASEIKAVLASGMVPAKLNQEVAIRFLRWSSTDTLPETMFAGIEAFPAGHVAVIDPSRPTRWTAAPYYSLADNVGELDLSFDEAVDRFRELFLSSVDIRLRSDVPVGFCLSGGLDSSSVVSAASRNKTSTLDTFTSSFDFQTCDERYWSDLVNERIQAKPHPVRPSATDFERDLASMLWHHDEPFATTSAYAQWAVMREARLAEIPVLLGGQGGDEILCGYRKYYMFYLQSLLRRRSVLRMGVETLSLIRHGDRHQWNFRDGSGSRYLPDVVQRRLLSVGAFLRPPFSAGWDSSISGLGLASMSIAKRQIADLQRHSLPALLRYEDRNSMAWSIEARVPFLDHRLVEFSVSLPIESKLSGGITKSILRQSLRGLVPDEILDRRDKLGFSAPLAEWLVDDLRDMVEKRLAQPELAAGQLIDAPALLAEFHDRVERRDSDALGKIFRVVVFDAWMERFGVEL